MVIAAPYRFLLGRSPLARKLIFTLSSETWSFLGLGFTALAAAAGHFRSPALFVAMIFGEVICDISDGYVYEEKERGLANGYGLYLDHVVDAIAVALATYGAYALVGHPLLCVFGLTMYYLIAIHSWLYKITRMARGDAQESYHAMGALNIDDLAAVVSVAVLTRWVPLYYAIGAALLIIFATKFVRTVIELRASAWHPAVRSSGADLGGGTPSAARAKISC